MSWVRLDDGVYDHPKLLAVSPRTRWVWVAGLAWSSRYRQDGLVPRGALHPLQGTPRDAAGLVAAGLWLPDPEAGGWRIHDYGQYQPMNGELSRKRSEAGRKGAQARWHV